jgi:hypothetical protein
LERLFELAQRRKFTILLLSLLAMALLPLLVADTAEPGGLVRPDDNLVSLLLGGVLIAAVNAVSERPRRGVVLAIAALVVFGGRIASVFGPDYTPQRIIDATSYSVAAIFLLATIVLVFRAILRAPRVNGDAVMGAVCVYLLIGYMWSNIYSIIYHVDETAFRFPDTMVMQDGALVPEYTFGYYSFVTLTTLGYGDITPISYPARTLSWMEAVVGVSYMATVIAFLVSQIVVDREAGREL